MTRFIRMRILLLVLLSHLLIVTSIQAEPVKLAVLLPLSNVRKDIGQRVKQGFLLGIQEEVAAHQVPWDAWVTFDFLDNRSDKDYSLQLAKEAIANGAQAILGPANSSGVCLNLQDYVLNEAKVPFILFAGCVSTKLRTTHPLFIRLTRSVPLLMTGLSQWLTEHPPVPREKPRWTCVHPDYVWGVGVCDGFNRAYGSVGEEIGRIPSPQKTVKKKRELVQLAKLKPDFALAAFVGAEAEVFIKDYYRFKVHETIPLVTAAVSAVSPPRLQAYEKTLEQYGTGVGILNAADYALTADHAANTHFVSRYQETYQTQPDPFSVWGYDGGRLLAKALIERQGQWDGAQVVKLMKTLPYTSPKQNQPVKFDSHGDMINAVYIFKTQRDGNRLINPMIGKVPPINMDEMLK